MASPATEPRAADSPLVDCDVHQAWSDPEAITDRLPTRYRKNCGYTLPGSAWSNPHGLNRRDAIPADGGRPGSDPETLLEHHVE